MQQSKSRSWQKLVLCKIHYVIYVPFKVFDTKIASFVGWSQNFPNFEKTVHRAASAISLKSVSVKESLLKRGEDVNAERVECALKIVMLMPDFSRVSTTQQVMVLGETGLCWVT